jgi:hypothetical protein
LSLSEESKIQLYIKGGCAIWSVKANVMTVSSLGRSLKLCTRENSCQVKQKKIFFQIFRNSSNGAKRIRR